MVMPPSMSLYLDHNVSESCAVLAAVWFTFHFSGEMDGESVPGKDAFHKENCIFFCQATHGYSRVFISFSDIFVP